MLWRKKEGDSRLNVGDLDVVLGHLKTHGLRHSLDKELGARVHTQARLASATRVRGDVDNVSFLTIDHAGQNGSDAIQHTDAVHVNHPALESTGQHVSARYDTTRLASRS